MTENEKLLEEARQEMETKSFEQQCEEFAEFVSQVEKERRGN